MHFNGSIKHVYYIEMLLLNFLFIFWFRFWLFQKRDTRQVCVYGNWVQTGFEVEALRIKRKEMKTFFHALEGWLEIKTGRNPEEREVLKNLSFLWWSQVGLVRGGHICRRTAAPCFGPSSSAYASNLYNGQVCFKFRSRVRGWVQLPQRNRWNAYKIRPMLTMTY